MPSQYSLNTVLATCSVLSFLPRTLAHMEMSWPYALHSKYNPANNYTDIDYSMTSPLVADGSNFPCKGYQNDRPIDSVVTYTAGSTYNMTLAGSATHGGGSCQLSLSYDNGATFRVIQSMIGGCPLSSTYDFTIPSYVPNGQALFAWSWQNLDGNREFYMNCAEVEITGSTAGSASKRSSSFATFDNLPFIWKANLEGINDCATVEGDVPVYPEPGPAVIYGTGIDSSTAASSEPGQCDAAKPFGQTYKYLSDSVNPATEDLSVYTASNTGVASSGSSTASSMPSVSPTTLITSSRPSTISSSSSSSSAAASSSRLPTLSTSTKAAATSGTPSSSTESTALSHKPSSSSFPSSASKSNAVTSSPYSDPSATATGTGTCPPDVSITAYNQPSSSTNTPTTTAAGPSSTESSAGTATSSSVDPEATDYATANLTTYLPCVPGTFICTSNITWVTCDQTMYSDGTTAWVYDDSRQVSPRTACFPNLSPYSSSTSAYEQQADAPAGYYRDDRIARDQAYGSCATEGAIQCASGGAQFFICDRGGLISMGDVAEGATCSDGAIVTQ